MSKNEPDSPGIVIPHILIKPQKNTNNKFLFSYSGSLKLINIPNSNPNIKYMIVLIFVFSILLIKCIVNQLLNQKNRPYIKSSFLIKK